MSVDSLGYALGFGAIGMVSVSVICMLLCIRRNFSLKKRSGLLMLPIYLGIIGSWFSVSLSFLLIWLFDIKMPDLLITYLWAWGPALQLLGWIYLGLHLWDFAYKRHLLFFSLIFSFFYLILMYFFPHENTEAVDLGGVPDTVAVGLGLILVAILVILSFSLVPSVFIWASYRTSNEKMRLRSRLIAFSSIVLGTFQFLSATSFEEPFLVFFLRGMTALMLVFLYWGFTMPSWLLKIFNLDN